MRAESARRPEVARAGPRRAARPRPRNSSLDLTLWDRERGGPRGRQPRAAPASPEARRASGCARRTLSPPSRSRRYLASVFALSLTSPSLAATWQTALPLLAAAIGRQPRSCCGVTRIPKLRPRARLRARLRLPVRARRSCSVASAPRPSPTTRALVRQVSPVVIPILAFGALIPATPETRADRLRRRGGDGSARARADAIRTPQALGCASRSSRSPRRSSPRWSPTGISRVVHRLSEGIVKAREVGSYRLVERLGVGGMAEVWRAEHRMLARPAAVKLIRPAVLIEHGPVDTRAPAAAVPARGAHHGVAELAAHDLRSTTSASRARAPSTT